MLVKCSEGIKYWTPLEFNSTALIHKFVMYDIANCLVTGRKTSSHSSLIDMSMNIRRCFRKHLYHCVKSKKQSGQHRGKLKLDNTVDENGQPIMMSFHSNSYCGIIAVQSRSAVSHGMANTILIRGTRGYVIHISMSLFNFDWCSLGCSAHGLGIIDSADGDKIWFCGKRLPWTIVLRGREVQIQIQIMRGKHMNAIFFYNKIKADWVQYYTAHIYNHPVVQSLLYSFLLSSHIDRFRMHYYTIHVIVLPMQLIRIIGTKIDSGAVLVGYDGPGVSSKRLSLPKHLKHNYGYQTDGFRAFFSVRIHNSQNLTLKLKVVNRRFDVMSGCKFRGGKLSRTSVGNITVNCYKQFTSRATSLRFAISEFKFVGPTMLDNLGDLDDCQYGGLFFKIKQKIVSICDDKYEYNVFQDGPSFTMVMLLYRGYSSGDIKATVYTEKCKTIHLDLIPSVFSYSQMILQTSDGCLRVVCPSLNYDRSRCNILYKIHERAIGVAKVKVKAYESLYACTKYMHENDTIYTYSASFSNDWPFVVAQRENVSSNIYHRLYEFPFLYELNISIPYVCQSNKLFNQLGVILQRTVCFIDQFNKPIFRSLFMRNILMFQMTNECIFISYKTRLDVNTSFLYYEKAKRQTGVEIFISYHPNCPNSCKNYTYNLRVWTKNENATDQYTGKVGETMFTGYYHNGFILEVIDPCPENTGCRIATAFYQPPYPVGNESKKFLNGNQRMQLYPQR